MCFDETQADGGTAWSIVSNQSRSHSQPMRELTGYNRSVRQRRAVDINQRHPECQFLTEVSAAMDFVHHPSLGMLQQAEGRNICSAPVAAEDEGGPVLGREMVEFGGLRVVTNDDQATVAFVQATVALIAEHPDLGFTQGGEFAQLFVPQVFVELLHQPRGGSVGNLPQASDNRLRQTLRNVMIGHFCEKAW